MGGTFHVYLSAATALWEMPMARIEELKVTGEPDALRRAAGDTLELKAQFLTPDTLGDERKAINILAASLQEDPDFTADLAISVGGRSRATQASGRTAPRPASVPRQIQRAKIVLAAVTVVAVFLLLLEVLAIAGVDVPNPIGEIIDRMGNEEPVGDETPAASGASLGRVPDLLDGPPSSAVALRPTIPRLVDTRTSETVEKKKAKKTKNPRHAGGKTLNQANGKERNQPSAKGAGNTPGGVVAAVAQARPPAARAAPSNAARHFKERHEARKPRR